MDKRNVVYVYYSFIKKEGNLAICSNIDYLEGIIPSEISQTEKGKYGWSHL